MFFEIMYVNLFHKRKGKFRLPADNKEGYT